LLRQFPKSQELRIIEHFMVDHIKRLTRRPSSAGVKIVTSCHHLLVICNKADICINDIQRIMQQVITEGGAT